MSVCCDIRIRLVSLLGYIHVHQSRGIIDLPTLHNYYYFNKCDFTEHQISYYVHYRTDRCKILLIICLRLWYCTDILFDMLNNIYYDLSELAEHYNSLPSRCQLPQCQHHGSNPTGWLGLFLSVLLFAICCFRLSYRVFYK